MGMFDTMKSKAEGWIRGHPQQMDKAKRQAERRLHGMSDKSRDSRHGRGEGGHDSDA